MSAAPDDGAALSPGGDRIEIRGLRYDAVHGVLEEERSAPQPFEVDLDLYVDLRPASTADDLGDSADYGRAVAAAASVLGGPPRQLLEALAEDIAAAVLGDPRVVSVTVAVRKLRPPVPERLASAGVRVTRRR
ncbi:MAG TPA: dihydroneopterin aldolase [Acidimicrobiales bacterium]|nr:dihydroneopterin aldolase [Acidimicrobiales bacterium]